MNSIAAFALLSLILILTLTLGRIACWSRGAPGRAGAHAAGVLVAA